MIDLSGTHGVIVGVANKRSLAWAIAQAMDAVGAQLTLSYATERFEGNVRKLGATLRQPPLIVPCDVTSDAQVRDLFEFRFEDFSLEGYDPHPHIKAEVSV